MTRILCIIIYYNMIKNYTEFDSYDINHILLILLVRIY